MKTSDVLKESLGQFGPLLAIGIALATFVALVPSRPADQSADRPFAAAADAGSPSGGPATTAPLGPPAESGTSQGTPRAAERAPVGGGGPARSGTAAPAGSSATPTVNAGGDSQGLFSGEDCARHAVLGPDYPCRPIWVGGDNGGATDVGVEADRIRIVVYQARTNEQVAAILANAGIATPAQTAANLEAQEAWFNQNFETFGREVEIIFQRGPGQGSDPAQMQADAKMIAQELKAFAVVAVSVTPDFHAELCRQGVPNFDGILPLTQQFLESCGGNALMAIPDVDLSMKHYAEWYCKRLHGHPARWAGDPVLASQERKLGVIYVESDYANLGEMFAGYLDEACGIRPHRMVGYPPDITQAQTIATNTIAQLKTSGTTTVLLLTDPVAPLFFTNESTRQGYFPEWNTTSFYGTDSDIAWRNYDPVQARAAFGITGIPTVVPLHVVGSWQAYWQTVGVDNGDYGEAVAASIEFGVIERLLRAIEETGPVITRRGLIEHVLSQPETGGQVYPFGGVAVRFGFGREPGPYSGINDFAEQWWNPDGRHPGGDAGMFHYVAGGQRKLLGEWPTGEPTMFVDDGSRQVDHDPERECRCYMGPRTDY